MGLHNRFKNFGLRKQKSILSASLILSFSFAVSAALGLIRDRVIYPRFLSCCPEQLDVYKAAFKLPDLVFKLLVTGALSASFMPVFLTYNQKDKKHAHLLASTVINVLSLLLIFSLVLIFILAWPFSRLLAPGFDQSQLLLMVRLTRILLVAQIFFLMSNFFTSIIQANQMFLVPSLSPILYNLTIIISTYLLAPIWGIYAVCFGAVIGSFLHFIIQLPIMIKIGFKYSPSLDTNVEGLKKITKLMIPRSLSLGLNEIESLFTLRWASLLSAGSFALYSLALQIVYIPSRIFSTTISQASMPALSQKLAQHKMKQFKKLVIKSLYQGLFLSMPVAALMLVHRLPIVRLVFGTRQFPWQATLIISRTIIFLTPSIFLQSIIQVLNRAFYAAHDTKTPLKISLVALVISLVATYAMITFTNLGILSLAIGMSISNFIQSFQLLTSFSKKISKLNFIKLTIRFLKITFASLTLSTTIWFVVQILDHNFIDTSRTFNLFILVTLSTIIGLSVFVLVSHLLKIDEIEDFFKLFSRKKVTIASQN